jgi:hypothetical protein
VGDSIEDDIRALEIKLGQLKREYDQYFLGTRPREPVMLAGDVRKFVAMISNQAIRNTGLRFKFSSLCSRYQAFNRVWQDTLRKIEQGSYVRHRFKAELHTREHEQAPATRTAAPTNRSVQADDPSLFAAYVQARKKCGQESKNLSPEALQVALHKQEQSLRARLGNAEIRFRVVIEDGVAKVKASRGT